jgi:signal transduction histidine kinase
MRAKDKSFNASFETNFDPNLSKINVVPQDIGRVLLNLINNAFYASSSKALAIEDGDYKPEVVVSTRKLNGKIEITVKDNGPGIPEEIKDKIFQPFFTTKPTGSGTGLGLSLSYDIVKAHGGELKLESKEHLGTEFIITIPIKEV